MVTVLFFVVTVLSNRIQLCIKLNFIRAKALERAKALFYFLKIIIIIRAQALKGRRPYCFP